MHDAAMERLSKIISDTPTNGDDGKGSRRVTFEVHLGLAEGWFSLILLAIVVYSTIWSVQAVGWVDHLNVLTLTTALGLIVGVVAAKQQRFPRLPIHLAALGFGLLLALWQTAGAFYQGDTGALVQGMHSWLTTVLTGGTGDDDSIFLFFITTLGFALAYTSAWLVYRTRSPWLMIVANAVVLLINLSNVDEGYIIFLVVFLMASLLLLLRFNLYDSVRRWRRQGLRYADDIGWDVMQAGALISIAILIFSWLLPSGYTDATTAQIWNANANPWVQLQNTWNRVISVNGGSNPANHGNFRDTLVLGGNPNLNHDVVLTVQSDESGQYLELLSYDTYTGHGWTNGSTTTQAIKANQLLSYGPIMAHAVQQKITIVNPPGEQYPYLLGVSEIASMSIPSNLLSSATNGSAVAWVGQNGTLAAGTRYTVISFVSSADEKTLRSVPLPVDAPRYPPTYDGPQPPTVYNQSTVDSYLQLPKNLDRSIADLARQVTAKAPTMYDKVVALESYLRTNYRYSVDIHLPPGEEGVSWFLFRSGNMGFCNYFSSAMTVMARSLGIPARVVAGYTSGEFDVKQHQRVVHGTDAHSWTQIYFAGYGWVNFEPSASFPSFTRPLPNQYGASGASSLGGGLSGSVIPPDLRNRNRRGSALDDTSGGATTAQAQQVQLRQQVGLAFGGVVLLILFACLLFGLWWSQLFRRYGLAARIYGRICVLANWAGIEIQPSQTPYEYIHVLAASSLKDVAPLERFGDIYVRDRWADPESMEHPRRSGEMNELPGIWKRLQPRLFLYVLRHPHFLWWLPERAWILFIALRRRQRVRRRSEEDL